MFTNFIIEILLNKNRKKKSRKQCSHLQISTGISIFPTKQIKTLRSSGSGPTLLFQKKGQHGGFQGVVRGPSRVPETQNESYFHTTLCFTRDPTSAHGSFPVHVHGTQKGSQWGSASLEPDYRDVQNVRWCPSRLFLDNTYFYQKWYSC